MASKKYASTKALDEFFTFAYKLRRAGIDPSLTKSIMDAILIGSPSISVGVDNETLTPEQQKVFDLFTENGFSVDQHGTTFVVTNNHFNTLKNDIEKYLEAN